MDLVYSQNVSFVSRWMVEGRSELDNGLGEVDDCRCKVHMPVKWGDPAASGCALREPGTHPSIAALYGEPAVKTCHADLATRRVDRKVALDIRAMRTWGMKTARKKIRLWRSRKSSRVFTCREFGSGYCFLPSFSGWYRMRVGRLLGPLCLLGDMIAVAVVFGDAECPQLGLEKVGESTYHVKLVGRSKTGNLSNFLKMAREVVCADPRARVGADQTEVWQIAGFSAAAHSGGVALKEDTTVAALSGLYGIPTVRLSTAGLDKYTGNTTAAGLREWLKGKGARVPKTGWADLALVSYASGLLPAEVSAYKERAATFAVLGDVALKRIACVRALVDGAMRSKYTSYLIAQENSSLAGWLEANFRQYTFTEGLRSGSKALADVAEAVLGVVAFYCTDRELLGLMEATGLLPKLNGKPRYLDLTWSPGGDGSDLALMVMGMSAAEQQALRTFLNLRLGK